MEYSYLYAFVAFVATSQVILADHFRGGSMSWRPIGNWTSGNKKVSVKLIQIIILM